MQQNRPRSLISKKLIDYLDLFDIVWMQFLSAAKLLQFKSVYSTPEQDYFYYGRNERQIRCTFITEPQLYKDNVNGILGHCARLGLIHCKVVPV